MDRESKLIAAFVLFGAIITGLFCIAAFIVIFPLSLICLLLLGFCYGLVSAADKYYPSIWGKGEE